MVNARKPGVGDVPATPASKPRAKRAPKSAAASEPGYDAKRAEVLATGQPMAGYMIPDGFTADVTVYLRREREDGDHDTCEHRIANMPLMPKLDDPAVAKTIVLQAMREIELAAGLKGWRLMTRDEVLEFLQLDKIQGGAKVSKRKAH